MDKIILPFIKRVLPTVDVNAIMSAQPMTEGPSYAMPYRIVDMALEPVVEPTQGDRRHSSVFGWQVFYGEDWIPERAYLKIKIAGL